MSGVTISSSVLALSRRISDEIHRQRRRVATPLTIPLTACPRGHPNGDWSGDRRPVPNLLPNLLSYCRHALRAKSRVPSRQPGTRLQCANLQNEQNSTLSSVSFVSFGGHSCMPSGVIDCTIRALNKKHCSRHQSSFVETINQREPT